MKIQKIHHIAVQQSVDHIANRPAQNADQRKGKQFLPGVGAQHPQDHDHRHGAYPSQKPALPARCISQKRESRAAVVHPYQVEKIGYVPAFAQTVVADHQHLGELVGQHNQAGQCQPVRQTNRAALACRGHQAKLRDSPSPNRLLVQRPHSLGWAGSMPRSSR